MGGIFRGILSRGILSGWILSVGFCPGQNVQGDFVQLDYGSDSGRSVGRRREVVDVYGDAIMNCGDIPGDSWRHRHDTVKQALVVECLASGLPHDCEVYGLFSDQLPAVVQEEGGDLQWGRSRQGLVPDFLLRLPSPEGPSDSLAELKICSAGKTWYPRGREGRGTDKRAGGLAKLYHDKLAVYDRRFHGAQPGHDSPLDRRLQAYGPCLVLR